MKMKKILLGASAIAVGITLASCGGGSNPSGTTANGGTGTKGTVPQSNVDSGKYEATIWVSETKGVTDLTKEQVVRFNKENPDYSIKATIRGISESEAATNMVTDVETGPDLYCFAQDQLNRLINAGALSKLGVKASETVKSTNSQKAVAAASVNGDLYCYPITADNGYFMIYNKSVISEANVGNLEAMVQECETKGYNFSMENETSGWYLSSWFFGAGCKSNWTTKADGSFASVDDDFCSANGLIAMEGMSHLVKSKNYVSSSSASDFGAAIPSAVVVTGTWGVKTAQDILGDNFACAKLPKYHVDGKEYQMGSFSGFKLMGVKPSKDANKAAALHKLAQYLSNEACQLERFEKFGWGPSNTAGAQSEKVLADVGLKALSEQLPYSTVQNQIHGSWWDIAKVLGQVAKDSKSTDDLQAGLDTYKAAIDAIFSMSDAEKRAFTIIGSLKNTEWKTDFEMEETAENSNVWVSKDTFTITEDDITNGLNEFKCRQGKSWDVSYGAGAENFKITTAGTYKIKLTVTGDSGTIELIAQ